MGKAKAQTAAKVKANAQRWYSLAIGSLVIARLFIEDPIILGRLKLVP
jgi:hypothetical protein